MFYGKAVFDKSKYATLTESSQSVVLSEKQPLPHLPSIKTSINILNKEKCFWRQTIAYWNPMFLLMPL